MIYKYNRKWRYMTACEVIKPFNATEKDTAQINTPQME
jgi:hypothetical protein